MMDAVIIIRHGSCRFFLDSKDRLGEKCEFIDEWELNEDELCEKKDNRLIITGEFQENFQTLMQRWANSGKHFLIMDYTPASVCMLGELMKQGIAGADVCCVSFFHSDEDTVKPVESGSEENALGWIKWYMEGIRRALSIHTVEIPYGFTLTEDFLQALFDREFPHAPAARYRRVWKGNAQRRIDEALDREGSVPEWLLKKLRETAEKKAEVKHE
jgi:hypothetical protein